MSRVIGFVKTEIKGGFLAVQLRNLRTVPAAALTPD